MRSRPRTGFVLELIDKEILSYLSKPTKTLADVKHTAEVLYNFDLRGKLPTEVFTGIYELGLLIYTIGYKYAFFSSAKQDADVRILIDALVNTIYTDEILMSQLLSHFSVKIQWNRPSDVKKDSLEEYVWYLIASFIEVLNSRCDMIISLPHFVRVCLKELGISDEAVVDTLACTHRQIGSEAFGRLRDLQLDGLKNAYFTDRFIQPPGTSWIFMDELLIGSQDAYRRAINVFDSRIAAIRLGFTDSIKTLKPKKIVKNKFGVIAESYELEFFQTLVFNLLSDGTLCFDHFGFAPAEKYFNRTPGGKGLFALLYNGLVAMYFDLTIPLIRVKQAPVPQLNTTGYDTMSMQEKIRHIDASVYDILVQRVRLSKDVHNIQDEQGDERTQSQELEKSLLSRKSRGPIHKHKPHFLKPISDNYCAPAHVQELYRYYCKRNSDERIPLGYTFVRWGVLDDKDAPEVLHRARHRTP